MKRYRWLLVGCYLPFCWLAMMVVHELGHVAGAYLTGGQVEKVVLHPLAISRTDLAENPQPMVVAWSGPLLGVILPVLLWWMFCRKQIPGEPLVRFFAGFCLIANGAYLGIGSFNRIGDAGDLLRLGSPNWLLWLFGVTTVPAGFWLWHGMGPGFGLGNASDREGRRAAYVSLGLFLITILLELTLSTTE